MLTSGLLIHLTPGDFDSESDSESDSGDDLGVEEALGAREGLTLGERNGNALPAVLETADGRSSIDVVRDLERMTGVGRVDVVFVGTDEPNTGDK